MAVVFGFIIATFLTFLLRVGVGPIDEATFGGLHILLWVISGSVISWIRRGESVPPKPQTDGFMRPHRGPSDHRRVSAVPTDSSLEPPSPPPSRMGGRTWLMATGLALLFLVAGFALGRSAGTSSASTSTSSTPVVNSPAEESQEPVLMDGARLWCLKDLDTFAEVFRAASVLGFENFSPTFVESVRNGNMPAAVVLNVFNEWSESPEFDEEYAASCLAAYLAR